jgi:hypothetical protein
MDADNWCRTPNTYDGSELDKAEDYLTRFLAEYDVEDGWRSSARGMLDRIHG